MDSVEFNPEMYEELGPEFLDPADDEQEYFFNSRIAHYETNRQNLVDGKINCIPSPFERFRGEFPGIEKGRYYITTGNEKSGKSQISDYLFLLHPIMYAYTNPDKLSVKILYFSLEMSKADKYDQLTCFWLYTHTRGAIRVNPKQLNSLSTPINPEVLELLKSDEYKDFFEFLEDNTIFYESVGNPTGIYHQCKNFAESRGTITYKEMEWQDNTTKEFTKKKVIDKFTPDNPSEYWIAMTDHYSLLTLEAKMDLRQTIGRLSAGYSVRLRNIYGFTMVGIQQQSAESQSNETFKMGRLAPHPGNLGDNKTTKNDVNVMLGIFAPWRFELGTYKGYDITKFKDHIRFLEMIVNRSGSPGATCALYFDGAVNYFAELPRPDDPNLEIFIDKALKAQGI